LQNSQLPGDIRLRKRLDGPTNSPTFPVGFQLKPFEPSDACAVHALLCEAFVDQNPDFGTWWRDLSHDDEYDPALVFLAVDHDGRLAAVAQCWTSGFVKDLATAGFARERGIGEALMRTVFDRFRATGVAHVDLKTSTTLNAAAVRLYRRLGMVEVEWAG
jgi:ribosomal protein S18 acetylase RimI-like enzyme